MRLIVAGLLLFVGLGCSFRITEFLEQFSQNHHHHQNERQGSEGVAVAELIPTFLVAFAVSLVSNLLFLQDSGIFNIAACSF